MLMENCMINKHFMISLVCIVFMHISVSAAQWESELVHYDGNGRLVYEPEPYTGHRIGDFSHAGYMGGGIDIPMGRNSEVIEARSATGIENGVIEAIILNDFQTFDAHIEGSGETLTLTIRQANGIGGRSVGFDNLKIYGVNGF